MSNAVELSFHPIGDGPTYAVVTLNRPEAANAFNTEVIDGLINAFNQVKEHKGCRLMLLQGRGKHFSAGADLAWMKNAATLSFEQNVADAERLTVLFETLYRMPLPTVALVKGAAFGGAVGLTACCDVAFAWPTARFCLSEIKLGILPAVILPYVARKIPPGQLRRLSLSGRVFSAQEAIDFGLVEATLSEATLRDELNGLLSGAPHAQKRLKELTLALADVSFQQGPQTVQTIAAARVGAEAQSGFAAFFGKQDPPWKLTLEGTIHGIIVDET